MTPNRSNKAPRHFLLDTVNFFLTLQDICDKVTAQTKNSGSGPVIRGSDEDVQIQTYIIYLYLQDLSQKEKQLLLSAIDAITEHMYFVKFNSPHTTIFLAVVPFLNQVKSALEPFCYTDEQAELTFAKMSDKITGSQTLPSPEAKKSAIADYLFGSIPKAVKNAVNPMLQANPKINEQFAQLAQLTREDILLSAKQEISIYSGIPSNPRLEVDGFPPYKLIPDELRNFYENNAVKKLTEISDILSKHRQAYKDAIMAAYRALLPSDQRTLHILPRVERFTSADHILRLFNTNEGFKNIILSNISYGDLYAELRGLNKLEALQDIIDAPNSLTDRLTLMAYRTREFKITESWQKSTSQTSSSLIKSIYSVIGSLVSVIANYIPGAAKRQLNRLQTRPEEEILAGLSRGKRTAGPSLFRRRRPRLFASPDHSPSGAKHETYDMGEQRTGRFNPRRR